MEVYGKYLQVLAQNFQNDYLSYSWAVRADRATARYTNRLLTLESHPDDGANVYLSIGVGVGWGFVSHGDHDKEG